MDNYYAFLKNGWRAFSFDDHAVYIWDSTNEYFVFVSTSVFERIAKEIETNPNHLSLKELVGICNEA